jgi:hypothetical protein
MTINAGSEARMIRGSWDRISALCNVEIRRSATQVALPDHHSMDTLMDRTGPRVQGA